MITVVTWNKIQVLHMQVEDLVKETTNVLPRVFSTLSNPGKED